MGARAMPDRKLELQFIEPRYVQRTWLNVKSFVESALNNSPWSEYDASQLRMMLSRAEAGMLVTVGLQGIEGVIVVQIMDMPSSKVAHVMAIGGIGVNECWNDFKLWCIDKGCTKIRGWGTPAIARLWEKLDMKEVCRVVECDL